MDWRATGIVCYPSNDKFLEDKERFKQVFTIHYLAKNDPPRNRRMHHMDDENNYWDEKKHWPNTSIFKWLKENKVFIAMDLIGHHAACTIGNLINIHPRITHCTTLEKHFLMPCKPFRCQKLKSSRWHQMPRPTTGKPWTAAIKWLNLSHPLKSSPWHSFMVLPPIMWQQTLSVLLQLHTITNYCENWPLDCSRTHQETSLMHSSCHPEYTQSLANLPTTTSCRKTMNFWQGASIPIEGIDETTLNTCISIIINNNKEDITVWELLLCNSWCTQVEQMETPGKIIIVMTKG